MTIILTSEALKLNGRLEISFRKYYLLHLTQILIIINLVVKVVGSVTKAGWEVVIRIKTLWRINASN